MACLESETHTWIQITPGATKVRCKICLKRRSSRKLEKLRKRGNTLTEITNEIVFVKTYKQLEIFDCWICNKAIHPKDYSKDHVIPKSIGGELYHSGNKSPAHKHCNNKRGSGLSEMGWMFAATLGHNEFNDKVTQFEARQIFFNMHKDYKSIRREAHAQRVLRASTVSLEEMKYI